MISKKKLHGESFSDTLERLVKKKGRLMDAVNSWDKVDEKEVEKIEMNIENIRKKFTSDIQERAE